MWRKIDIWLQQVCANCEATASNYNCAMGKNHRTGNKIVEMRECRMGAVFQVFQRKQKKRRKEKSDGIITVSNEFVGISTATFARSDHKQSEILSEWFVQYIRWGLIIRNKRHKTSDPNISRFGWRNMQRKTYVETDFFPTNTASERHFDTGHARRNHALRTAADRRKGVTTVSRRGEGLGDAAEDAVHVGEADDTDTPEGRGSCGARGTLGADRCCSFFGRSLRGEIKIPQINTIFQHVVKKRQTLLNATIFWCKNVFKCKMTTFYTPKGRFALIDDSLF